MADKPIIFSAPMVRAILKGRKTQTRRPVKPQPALSGSWHGHEFSVGGRDFYCPYGKPGDLLWVRESFAGGPTKNEYPVLLYRADFKDGYAPAALRFMTAKKWTPSIYMPRWASRLTLRITDVRVERVRDISEADAQAEGVYTDPACPAYDSFQTLWNSINSKRGHGWDVNPWVWVLTFEVIHKNIDAVILEQDECHADANA